MKSYIALLPALFACAKLGTTGNIQQLSQDIQSSPALSNSFTDVNPHSDTYQKQFSLDDYLDCGMPVIVNFWEPWCPPCIAEMPALQRRYEEGDVVIIGLSYDLSVRINSKILSVDDTLMNITYPYSGLKSESNNVRALDSLFFPNMDSAVPVTVVFNAEGKLEHVYRGQLKDREIERLGK